MADQPMSPTPPADASAQQWLDLALRLLAAQFHVANDQLRLSTGAHPDDLPFALPLPEDARILGALSVAPLDQPEQHRPLTIIILVETPHTLEQGAQRLSAALEAQGWKQNAPPHMRGGFVHVVPGYNFMRYGLPSSDDILTISPLPNASEQPTTFSISVQRESPQFLRRPIDYHDQRELIPALFPPAGATQQGGGGGGGGGSNSRIYATATLSTDHTTTEVMDNYDRQLEAGGWRRRSGGASGSVGWSYWTFNDDEGAEWRGALAVFGDPERPRDYLAFIQIESDNAKDSRLVGWQSHSFIKG